MTKALWKVLVTCLMISSVTLFAGCGSGGGTGGASNMSITLSGLSSSTIEAGTNVSGTLNIAASSSALNEVQVDIKTDNAAVIGSAHRTDNLGNAGFTLTASPNAALSATVNVWAEYNGVKSSSLQINLKSWAESSTFEFTEVPSVPYSRSAVIGTAATTYSTIVSGNSVVFKDPSGSVVSGVPVEIRILQFNGYTAGDKVSVLTTSGYVDYTGVNPTNTASFTITAVDGKLEIPTTYTYVVPGAASPAGTETPHTYSVVWQAKVTYGGREYLKTAVTTVTATTTSTDPPAI